MSNVEQKDTQMHQFSCQFINIDNVFSLNENYYYCANKRLEQYRKKIKSNLRL